MTEPRINPKEMCPEVLFATPAVDHQFAVCFQRSMMETQWLLAQHGVTSGVLVRPGDCFVDKARNKLVGDFLVQFPYTENFFFLDDDIGWEPAKVLEFLRRPDPVVAGVYPKKSDSEDKWPCSFAVNEETGELYEDQGMYLAVLAPPGFMRIKRNVLETLAAQASVFEDREVDGRVVSYPYIFESGRGADGKYWGEDFTFCRKVREAGFPIWVDPNITFKHQGIRIWEDTLANALPVFRHRAKLYAEGKIDRETGDIIDDVEKSQAAA